MSPKPKVLVVDDEEAIRSSLRMIFEYDPPGYECLLAANGQAAIKMVERELPDLVFLDIKMPQMDGMEVLKAIKSVEDSPPVVILSGHGTVATAVEATKAGAYDFIEKPPDRERLLLVARNAISQRKLGEENRRLKLSFDERYRMEGESAALQKVWDDVRARRAHERDRPHHGRERRGQGARRARDPSEFESRGTRPSSRSTARPSRRS